MLPDEKDAQIAREIRPCRHMARWVDALADGCLRGAARWYVELHVKSCRQCYTTLTSIRKARQLLNALRHKDKSLALSSTRQLSLADQLDEVEKCRKS